MQFIVIGRDGKDVHALDRRMKARPDHIALGDRLVAEGRQLMGVALLDEKGQMCGSMLICDYPDRASLNQWLREEPYVTQGVWKDIEVNECRVGPSFQKLFENRP